MIPFTPTRELLVGELGLDALSPEQQDEILAGLGEIITQGVMLAVFLKLPEVARDEFVALSEKNDSTGMQTLLETHIPDLPAFIANETYKEILSYKDMVAQKLANS